METVPIFKGKKVKHVSDLVAVLAILGPCSVQECAKKIFKISKNNQDKVRIRENNYRNLCNDYMRNGQKYSGLISEGYVFKSGEEGRFSTYALTLKGCFLALGYEFDDEDLRSFIKQAATTHLFFAYVNRILEQTSLSFAKEIFVYPIRDIIGKGKITLDDDIRYYFSNIAEACGRALYQKLDPMLENYYSHYYAGKITETLNSIHPQNMSISILKRNTFYHYNPPVDWFDSIIEYFYSEEEIQKFYDLHKIDLSLSMEKGLVEKVMREIHRAYFWSYGMPSPKYTNKLPHSKGMREYIRYKKRYPPKNSRYFKPKAV